MTCYFCALDSPSFETANSGELHKLKTSTAEDEYKVTNELSICQGSPGLGGGVALDPVGLTVALLSSSPVTMKLKLEC